MKTILALDQSTVATGWALFHISGESMELVEYGTVGTISRAQESHLWLDMFSEIEELIKQCCPDVVVIEDTIMQKSPHTLKTLTRLQGAIIAFARHYGVECEYLYPSQWRKLIELPVKRGMKRKEQKALAKQYVNEHYAVSPSEDECDAICIGTAYIKLLDQTEEI